MIRWLRESSKPAQSGASDPDGPRSTVGRRTDERGPADGRREPRPTRRESLRALGGAVALPVLSDRTRAGVDQRGDGEDPRGDREDFLWAGAGLWTDPQARETLLATAERYDLAMCLGQPPANRPGTGEVIRPALEAASERGLEAWVNLGVLKDVAPREFLEDADARERHLAGLREVAELHGELFDGGRVILWQEAPVMGQWDPDGKWTPQSVRNLLDHGPAVFEAQRAAIGSANPDLDVGIFVHFPYVVDSKRPEVFPALVDGLRERDATPDFGFADFYRGWYEKDVGPGPADDAVRSLVSNAREHLDRDVFYLGQAHTINPGHTPSKQSMRSNLRASLEAGAAGVGWFASSDPTPTTQGFDPFVPNDPDATYDGGLASTPTIARDRYEYAYGATLASRSGVDRGERVDLWLHGDGFGFADHRVEARGPDGEWTHLGDVGGYLDGDNRHANGRTAVIRALDRERFAADGAVDLRIRTGEGADATALETVRAMPWSPDDFVTERAATELIEGDADLAPRELGRAAPGTDLAPGSDRRVTVPVEGGAPSLTPLVHPGYTEAVRRLRAITERPTVDLDARFDLWLTGRALGESGPGALLVDADGRRVDPGAAADVTVANGEAAVHYGLDRARFLGDGLDLVGDGRAARVDAAYAMPAADGATFRSPSRAADLLASQPREAAIFALDWRRAE